MSDQNDTKKVTEQTVVLDGRRITEDQLNKASEQKNVRIVKQDEGTFKTLNRLHG